MSGCVTGMGLRAMKNGRKKPPEVAARAAALALQQPEVGVAQAHTPKYFFVFVEVLLFGLV